MSTSAALAGVGAEGGLAWLRNAQRPDGLWGFDDRLVIRDSVEVLQAFESLAPQDPILVSARETLAAQAPSTVDLEARLVAALRPSIPEPILAVSLAELAGMRSRQGGWGITAGFETCDALDTALALRALVGTSYLDTTNLVADVNCLTALQNADGGFGRASGEISDLKTSAEVLRALSVVSRVGTVDTLFEALVHFLLAQQMADGGFPAFAGAETSDVRTTALVIFALTSSGANASVQYPAARSYLLGAQLPNGSWEDSAYVTAMGSVALGSARPDLFISKAEFTPSMTPRGPDVSLTFSIANLGLAEASPTVAKVYLGDPSAGGALQATVPVWTIPAGGVKALTTAISTMLTVETSLPFFVVADAENTLVEACETNNRAVSILEISTSPAPATALSTPNITSMPTIRATVGTTYTYQMVATHAVDDPVGFGNWIMPSGMNIDGATGLISWPVNVPAGTRVNVVATVCASNYRCTGQGWSIDVVETGTTWPPTIDTIPSSAAVVGQPYIYGLDGTDPDLSLITYQLVAGPPGMTLNPSTNVLSWTPTSADVGDVIVRVVAVDAQNETGEQQWIIAVDPVSVLKPDLTIATIDLSQSPTDPQTLHRDGAVVVTVANQGTGAAGAFNLVVYEDRDRSRTYAAATDRLLGTASVPSLASNQRTDVVVAISGETLFRDNRVAVYVDPENLVEELREDNNGDLSGSGTRFVPVPGPFRASVKWQVNRPNYGGAYQTPIAIGQLRDDNGDGRHDSLDTPEIVAAGTYEQLVTAYDGRSGNLAWNVSRCFQGTCGAVTPTVADADGDGVPEIYLWSQFTNLVSYNPDGSGRWRTMSLLEPGRGYDGGDAITGYTWMGINVADLDGDGTGEIVTPTAIVEADGITRCFLPLNSPHDNVVADLDGDGKQEVISLPYVFRSDCSVLWSHAEWGTYSAGLAVAQLDDDPQPEIVWTRADGLWIVEHDGVVKWKALTPAGYGPGNSTYVSQPAIGDIDGDGQPEIVFNDRFKIGAYKRDGTGRWTAGIIAAQPRGGSPTLADFDGDGRFEVVHNDDGQFRILDGKTGTTLCSYSNSYGGIPAIADVDGDGHLEIAVAHIGSGYGGAMTVFGNPNWAPGPRIWNQPSYHITNIQEDMRIPRQEIPSWQAHNTYRAQASVSHTICAECGDTGASTDLTVSFIRLDASGCAAQAKYTVRVGNGGGVGVPAGTKVRFVAVTTAGSTSLGDVNTTRTLASGDYEDVSLTVTGSADPIQLVVTVDPDQSVADGKRDNNVHSFSLVPCSIYDNTRPHFISTPPVHAEAGRDWAYFPAAFDADGDPITFAVTTHPTGMTGPAPTGGPMVWSPTSDQLGLQEVSIQASDGRGGLDVQSFLVEVKAPPLGEPPTAPSAGDLVLTVTTDRSSYGPEEDVAVTTAIQNMSEAGRTGSLRVELRDSTGMSLATVTDSTRILFTGTGTQTLTGTFNTGLLLVGAYQVVAVYDEGATVNLAQAPFTVTGSPALSVSVSTEHSQYGANESVRIVGQMQNSSPNAVLDGVEAKLYVLDGASAVLAEQEFDALSLGASTFQRQELLFDTVLTPPGDYRARYEVRQSGVLMASAESHFTIASSATRGSSLSGDVVSSPGTVTIGSSFALTGVITNIGNTALAGLDVRLQVVNPTTQQIVRELQRPADLAMRASTSKEAVFSTMGLAPKSYIGRLQVTSDGQTLLSVATEVLVEPGPPPAVSIQVASCGTADVLPVIVVQGGAPPLAQVAYLDMQVYDGQAVAAEGTHLIEVQVTDAIGRVAPATAMFVIDRTTPVVSIHGAAEDGAYNQPVSPAIAADDPNLVSLTATLNGAAYEGGSAIEAEGNYQVDAEAVDCAGNRASNRMRFLIDLTPPSVAIEVPACARGPITPAVTEVEANPGTTVRLLDGSVYDGTPVSGEGSHALVVTAMDRAGNRGDAQATFVLDNTPPAIAVSGVVAGAAYPAPVSPAVNTTDANLVATSVTLDGAPFVSGTTVDQEGTHLLLATARDCAGNPATVSTSFTVDRTAPAIVIDVPACSAGLVVPVIAVTEPNVATDERLLDGQPYDGGGVTAEGQHNLKVTVTDTAGNKTTNARDFTVDNTAPTITIEGVEAGGVYRSEVTPRVVFQDAVEITLTHNGAPFESGAVVGDEGNHAISATARDCAGNQASLEARFLIDKTPPVVTITVPACGAQDAIPTVAVDDAHLVTDDRMLDGQPWDGLSVASEGTHLLEVAATDTAGNRTQQAASFIVDKTAPVIAFSGFNDGGYHNTPVTPVIAISEPNLTESSMDLDAQPYQAGSSVSSEGAHVLSVTAKDCAGNTANGTASFALDFTAPVLSIAGIPACTSAGGVSTSVTADEVVTLAQTLDGSPYNSGEAIATEGAHTLGVTATDRAGNQASQEVGFIVDRTAPTATIVGVVNGGAYRIPIAPVIVYVDVNGVEGNATLNGQPFASGTPVSLDGNYQLVASGMDCAGNAVSASATFIVDTVAPTVQITGVEACASGPARPLVLAGDPNRPEAPVSLVCTLDQQPLASCDGLVLEWEGAHTLAVVATDQAGNTSEASTFFKVDNTAPVVEVVGLSDGGVYNTAVAPSVIVTEANPIETIITLDGVPFSSGTLVTIEGPHVLAVSARDCAGHVAGPRSWSFLVDTTPPEVRIDELLACNGGDVMPVVTVTDTNPTTTTKLLDGVEHNGQPVTLEGAHILTVTATDIARNQGTASAAFLIDRTKPHVSVTGVQNGAFYPGSVAPVVAVSDMNLAASSVTLNGAPFVSGSSISDAGSYTVAVTASDCAGNRESQTVSFEIRPYQGAISQELVSNARVLLARECTGCSPDLLRSTLSNLGIPFEEADNRSTWIAKLRSGRFNQVILFEPNPEEESPGFKELNEAVWLGDGLLFIKSIPDAMPNLRESLGLDFNGNVSVPGVSLLAPLQPASLPATGSGVKLKLSGASGVGCAGSSCTGTKEVVAAAYGRGLGRSVTLAWNTESSGSAQLYQTALAASAPAQSTPLLPGGLVQVKTTVRNLGVLETTYVVNSLLPAGASTWESQSRTLVLTGGQASSFTLPLLLPGAAGTYLVAADLTLGGGLPWAILDANTVSLTVHRSVETIGSDIVTALQALQLSGGQASKRASAVASVQAASAAATPALAIDQILLAITNVRAITAVDVTSIRIDIARLLRTYESRWQP